MLQKALHSRTVWIIVATFVLAGFEGVRDFIPMGFQTPIFAVLGLAATYFKLSPSQNYK